MEKVHHTTIQRQLENNALNHGYIFEGQDRELLFEEAKKLAQTIFCQNEDIYFCGKCAHCLKFEHESYIDLKIVEPKKDNIPIDDIRDIILFLSTRPIENRKKIVIIKDAMKMNREASNSLLKTLEEPPEYALIILTTNSKELLLPTIQSRCQHIFYSTKQDREQKIDREKIYLDLEQVIIGDISSVFIIAQEWKEYIDFKEELMDRIIDFFKEIYIYKMTSEMKRIEKKGYEQAISRIVDWSEQEILRIIEKIGEVKLSFKRNVNFQLSIEEVLLSIWEVRND